jgi:hypothetical protein
MGCVTNVPNGGDIQRRSRARFLTALCRMQE